MSNELQKPSKRRDPTMLDVLLSVPDTAASALRGGVKNFLGAPGDIWNLYVAANNALPNSTVTSRAVRAIGPTKYGSQFFGEVLPEATPISSYQPTIPRQETQSVVEDLLGPFMLGPANAAQKAAGRAVTKAGEPFVPALQHVQNSLSAAYASPRLQVVAPRDEAMRIAQQNAAKPVSEGGLGLRPDNMPMERARALGFDEREYIGVHKAPTSASTGYSAPLHELNRTYPDDIYSSMAARYYGDGANPARDAALIRKMQAFRAKPDAQVEVFRAVPKNAGDSINQGDWVTMDRRYAIEHGDGALGGDYKIISTKTPAKTLFTEGNSIYELGIDKTQKFAEGPSSMPTMVSNRAPFERSRFAAFDPARVNENDMLGFVNPRLLAALGLGSAAAVAGNSLLNSGKKKMEDAKKARQQAIEKAEKK
jgi:hypothetical protein